MSTQTRDADDVTKVMKSMRFMERLGYRTFPLAPHAKKPLHKGWQTRDYSKFDWEGHFTACGGYGVQLGNDDVVLDFDPRNGGDTSLDAIDWEHDLLLRYPHVRTGSGGHHVYAKKDPSIVLVHHHARCPGMDVQGAGRYVVGPGSLHPDTGEPYRKGGDWGTVPQLSDALASLLRKSDRPARERSIGSALGTPEKLAAMLAVLDPHDFASNQKWQPLAMSCHAYTGGEGYEAFAEWCAQDAAYSDHDWLNKNRWDSFAAKGGITPATLFAAVRDAGYPELVAQADHVDAADDFDDEDSEDSEDRALDASGAGLPTTIEQMDAALCVIQIQGKVRIASLEPVETNDSRVIKVPVFSDQANMRLLFSNRKVSSKAVNDEGEAVTTRAPLFDRWLSRKNRPTAIGFTMDPHGGRIVGGKFNLWQGFGIAPAAGDWSRLKSHILNVLACGNELHANYIIRYTAWVLQNPTRPAEVVLVLKGDKGTGKGEFLRLLCYIFGAHGLQISDSKHLVGSFNRHLQQTCLLFADEAFWPGNKGDEGPLKRLITEPTLTIEPKGIDAYESPNRLTIVMASNESWVVPASSGERRYAVFEVSSRHAQDFDYFAALRAETYERGGAAAFLHDMLAMDLAGWHPRQDIPQTDAMRAQQAESADPLDKWLAEILSEGELPGVVFDETDKRRHLIVHRKDPTRAKGSLLLEHAKHHMGSKRLSPHSFWAFLGKYGISEVRTRADRWRRFPPLGELRAAFARANPWWVDVEDGSEWGRASTTSAIDDFLDDDGDTD